MLMLVILIFGAIVSGLFSVYLYNLEDVSFILLYPYFFGTLIVSGFFILNIISIIIYAIALIKSPSSTVREKNLSKLLLLIIGILLIVSSIMYSRYLSYIGSEEWKNEQYIKNYGNK